MAVISIDLQPGRRTLRNFGFMAVVAFGAFGSLAHWHIYPLGSLSEGAAATTSYILWGLALYCGLCAVAAPIAVKPVYVILTVATYPIGFVLSYVVMAAMFYLILTPIGIVFKIIGRDALHRRFDPSAATYWIRRCPPETVKRYFRQF